ncbi:hypothetical protein ACWGMO_19495 [Nocardia salmonicida]
MNSSAMDRIYDPLIIANGRTASSFLGNADELVSQLVSYFAENVMPCQALPSEAMRGDVTEFTRRCLMLAMEMLDKRTTPSEPQLVALRAASAQHAREGVPVGTLLRAYAEGFRIGFELVIGQVTAADLAEFVAGTRLLLRTLEVINATVTSAYLDEQRQVAKEHQTGAQTMMSALLSGHGIGALTRQTGIRVADSYQVVALMIPELPDEHDPRVDAQVVARRKLRRVQAALADAFASRSLALLSTTGGTLLIPSDEPDTARMRHPRHDQRDLGGRAHRDPGARPDRPDTQGHRGSTRAARSGAWHRQTRRPVRALGCGDRVPAHPSRSGA